MQHIIVAVDFLNRFENLLAPRSLNPGPPKEGYASCICSVPSPITVLYIRTDSTYKFLDQLCSLSSSYLYLYFVVLLCL